ncbi:MAG TPA: hypothetical protein VNL95_04995 [Dehalococcoidia bacterium]|nr:hypothetical protein [Dehalococcoidia bacterium]
MGRELPPVPAAEALATSSPSPQFVRAVGRDLYAGNQPVRFVGVNRYNLLSVYTGGVLQGCSSDWTLSQLEQVFAELEAMGVNAVRFWAFQRFTASGRDFSRFDQVISLARSHNIYLVPVLENQWSSCTEGGYKTSDWYRGGYLRPYGSYPISYKEYVGRVVSRYRDEPIILMWQLMNEAESTDATRTRHDPDALYAFAADMSAYVKSLDPNHLLALGTMGSGQPGTQGDEYRRLHSLPGLDVLEYHDYNEETVPLPDYLRERIQDSIVLGKPLIIGEAGISLGQFDAQTRARLFDAKMSAAFQNGVAAYLIWSYRNRVYEGDYQFTPADPLAAVLSSYRWGAVGGGPLGGATSASVGAQPVPPTPVGASLEPRGYGLAAIVPPTDGDVTFYRLQGALNADFTFGVTALDVPASALAEGGMLVGAPDKDGAIFYYRLAACNAGGCSPYAPVGALATRRYPQGSADRWDFVVGVSRRSGWVDAWAQAPGSFQAATFNYWDGVQGFGGVLRESCAPPPGQPCQRSWPTGSIVVSVSQVLAPGLELGLAVPLP